MNGTDVVLRRLSGEDRSEGNALHHHGFNLGTSSAPPPANTETSALTQRGRGTCPARPGPQPALRLATPTGGCHTHTRCDERAEGQRRNTFARTLTYRHRGGAFPPHSRRLRLPWAPGRGAAGGRAAAAFGSRGRRARLGLSLWLSCQVREFRSIAFARDRFYHLEETPIFSSLKSTKSTSEHRLRNEGREFTTRDTRLTDHAPTLLGETTSPGPQSRRRVQATRRPASVGTGRCLC